MKSIFNPSERQEILSRIERLNENNQPAWGKMSAAQMCAHCAIVLDTNAGVVEEAQPPFIMKLFKSSIKKMIVGEKPYPKNSPTAKNFIVKEDKDLSNEKRNLIDRINYFTENKEQVVNHPSKLFGKLTEQEKGWAQYKHLNYHLEQFGV